MRRNFALILILIINPGGLAASPAPGDICVENATADPYFFTIDAGDGNRRSGELLPGGMLCLAGAAAKTVVAAAFVDDNVLEGCSRLMKSANMARLLRYDGVDRCEWEMVRHE